MERMRKVRRYTAEETVARGEAIYELEIRPKVEPEHVGRHLVADITTVAYSISDNELAAFESAEQRDPDGWFYAKRVGREAVHRIGGTRLSASPNR